CETLESRLLLSATILDLSAPRDVTGQLSAADPAPEYHVEQGTGRLDLHLTSATPGLRLSLFAGGSRLIDSIGVPAAGTDAHVRQHVSGPVFARVEGPIGAKFELTASFQVVLDPFQPLPIDQQVSDVLARDLNGDGHGDLAWLTSGPERSQILIFQGLGDGSFAEAGSVPLPPLLLPGFSSLLAGNVDLGGGVRLLVSGNDYGPQGLPESVLISVGWRGGRDFDVTTLPMDAALQPAAVADLDGDGLDEIVLAGTPGLFVLKPDGNGGF